MPIARAVLDRPWRRLAWSLPAALVLTGLAMAGFLRLLTSGPPLSAVRPVMLQIIELPPAPVESTPAVPEAPPPSETPPPPVTIVQPPETTPPVKPPPLRPTRKPEPPRRPVRREPMRQHPAKQQNAPVAAAPGSPSVPAPVPKSAAAGITMGARALYKPMPEIPEALRHRRLSVVALARFHVAADGSATVTLLQATPDPGLNAGLMAALQKWRFFPAMDNGRAVASTIDIRVPIEVR